MNTSSTKILRYNKILQIAKSEENNQIYYWNAAKNRTEAEKSKLNQLTQYLTHYHNPSSEPIKASMYENQQVIIGMIGEAIVNAKDKIKEMEALEQTAFNRIKSKTIQRKMYDKLIHKYTIEQCKEQSIKQQSSLLEQLTNQAHGKRTLSDE